MDELGKAEARRCFREQIGMVIRRRRKKAGYSQENLGSYLGVTAATVSRYERGKGEIPASSLPLVSNYCNFDIREFVDGHGSRKPGELMAMVAGAARGARVSLRMATDFMPEEAAFFDSYVSNRPEKRKFLEESVRLLEAASRAQVPDDAVGSIGCAIEDAIVRDPDHRCSRRLQDYVSVMGEFLEQ